MPPRDKTESTVDTTTDTRPLISDLLAKHASAIRNVREIIQEDELYKANSSRYDDIWILRFVLSHKGNVKASSKVILKTIKFRHEKKLNELGDIRHMIPSTCVPPDKVFPCHALYNSFCEQDGLLHTLPNDDRGIVSYLTMSKVNLKDIAANTSYQIQDSITRRTGKLTKQLEVIDLKDFKLKQLNQTFLKKDAQASKVLEDFYPQLVGTVLVVNSPSWLSGIWNVLRPLFPRRWVEKVDILPAMDKMKSRHLDRFLTYVCLGDLPEKYGGQNKEWPLRCANSKFGNVENE